MRRKFDHVYQIKIQLEKVKPPIWRRIQVPETYTFWELHVAIQDAMGWLDMHLHHFEILNPKTGMVEEIGIPDEEDMMEEKIIPGWKRKIARYFTNESVIAKYIYDYGDWWSHTVKLEKILPREKEVTYPICIDGARACPPEDCKGPWGYQQLLEAIANPDHEEHEEMVEWVGEDFDPEYFDKDEVVFDDPAERLKFLF